MSFSDSLAHFIFARRRPILIIFMLITVGMIGSASQLRIDSGFSKLIPLQHPYMKVFSEYAEIFGHADRVLIAVIASDGDMFTPEFFRTLEEITDKVFFMPGVDRTQVRSLFTPNVRYTEVVEDGISGGNVIPDDFDFSKTDLGIVRDNSLKAGIVGRLVANDFSGALVTAQLMEIDPNTGRRLDYLQVAEYLEREIRSEFGGEDSPVDIHIIGYARLIGDIADGIKLIIVFFFITLLITYGLVAFYAQSWRLAAVPIVCSLVSVIWLIGMLPLIGYGIDPMSILVPFLVFAVGISHGIQMLSGLRGGLYLGQDQKQATRHTFSRLLIPGAVALLSDTIGFITILAIDIGIIREMAITASLGVALVILTNLILLPVLLADVRLPGDYAQRIQILHDRMQHLWWRLSGITCAKPAAVMIACAVLLLVVGLHYGMAIEIGDRHTGVPELHPEARYNVDSRLIADKFSVGTDVMTVFAQTHSQACVDYTVMNDLDRFAWYVENHPGVHSTQSLSELTKHIHAGLNEGSLKWHTLPRNESVLAQAVSHVPTSSGLLNTDCSVMPVIIYTRDHKAETISNIVSYIKGYRSAVDREIIEYRLAGGNIGVMAATNQEVAASQFPILFYVYGAIIVLCLLSFRSLAATACIVLPLALVSLLTYALMSGLEIGLKVNTLPVVALGVGIGVDYGIYIFSRVREYLAQARPLRQAYYHALTTTGFGVLTTALTLAAGVMTWIYSPLQFQADMGILLVFMFLASMLGTLLLLPALARWLLPANTT